MIITVRKIAGVVLILLGALVLGILVSNGMIFPHLVGPAILIAAGILLLTLKRKGEGHE